MNLNLKKVLVTILSLPALFFVGCNEDETTPDRPSIESSVPTNNAVGVAVGTNITFVFNEEMDSSTINATSIVLKAGTTTVSGLVTYSNKSVVFTPTLDLDLMTLYTGTVSVNVANTEGITLEKAYVLSFTTGDVASDPIPTITNTVPLSDEVGVSTNTTVDFVFDEEMDSTTVNITTVVLKAGSTIVEGLVSYSDKTAHFTPTDELGFSTLYTATVSEAVSSTNGVALAAEYVMSFTTAAFVDDSAPFVTTTIPLADAIGVALGSTVSFTFNEEMDSSTVDGSSVVLTSGTAVITGMVSYSGNTILFTPTTSLELSTLYTATVSANVSNIGGLNLDSDFVISFTTADLLDDTAPFVSSSVPTADATGVAIGSTVAFVFNEEMDVSTINSSSVTLKAGTIAIAGMVSYIDKTIRFTPTENLEFSTQYTGRVSASVANMDGLMLETDFVVDFTTAASIDSTAPFISSTVPLSGAVGVSTGSTVAFVFNEEMDVATIDASKITLKAGTSAVSGTVSYSNKTALFTPTTSLDFATVYTGRVSATVANADGLVLGTDFVMSFTTAAFVDDTAPFITSSVPSANAVDIGTGTTVAFVFNEDLDVSTINTTNVTLKAGTSSVSGSVSYSNKTIVFTPSAALANGTLYTAKVSVGVANTAGLNLGAAFVINFTTAAIVDNTPPLIASTVPSNNASNVDRNVIVSITFSEAMNPSTINVNTFTVKKGSVVQSGTIAYSGATATFTGNAQFESNTVYTARISTVAKDIAGNSLAQSTSWSFTTGGVPGLATVNLRSAANYVILAKAAINNSTTSAITGDLGLSPAATTFITGLALVDATGFATSSQVTGKVFAADMAAPTPITLTTAVSDMITAYNDAAGRPTPDFLELGTGNIGGMTLTAGLYKWTNTVTIPSDVTISGSANDIWIFQIAGNLSQSAAVNVTLTGGAQAKNIFWQIAGEATIGTTAHMEGNILSMTGITFQTGASLKGRALAQTAVILDANAITKVE